jgi:fatty acid synthase subunit beta
MGMDLYERSSIARNLWDRCDAYFEKQFGFQLRKIVCENPTELVIQFGGPRGRQLRQNYMQMVYEIPEDGSIHLRRMFPEVTAETTAYRFRYPGGLLFATQFAQPALTVMEMASFQDAASRQVVPQNAVFAGHSLGEYAALAAVTDFVALEKLLYVVFCRGLTMQSAVERDDLNRSSYGMMAIDPYRVSPGKFFYSHAQEYILT